MDENELKRILDKTKKKIAISQFEKEEKVVKRKTIERKLPKVGIGIAVCILLSVTTVGAYVGITKNSDILKKLGINICEKYEENKQDINASEMEIESCNINLISAACDSTCIVLEIDFKLKDNKYEEVDFDIENLVLTAGDFEGSNKKGLEITEDSVSTKKEDGSIKLFKYISIKDPNLVDDGFLNEIFAINETAKCKIEFSKIYDKESKEIIEEGDYSFDFELKGKPISEFKEINKTLKLKDVNIEIISSSKSDLGNYISLIASQENFDKNKENNVQKLKYIVKNSKGEDVKILSETQNITKDYTNGLKIAIETTLKLDDISDDLNYDISIEIEDEIKVETNKIEQKVNNVEPNEEKKNQTVIKQENKNIDEQKSTTKNSLKKCLDKTELIITTKFGFFNHMGIDIGANNGEKIFATYKGKVKEVGCDENLGNYIVIDYGDGIEILYGACSKIAKNKGENVKLGEVVAYVGSTGNSTGPHLHLEVIKNGKRIDPVQFMDFIN